MFDIIVKFIVLPFMVFFIFGFLYYGLWNLLHQKKEETKTAS